MTAEIERVTSLPLRQLAAEVMVRGFGPDGPGGPGKPGTIEAPTMLAAPRATASSIAVRFIPPHRARSIGMELQARLTQLLAEGLQSDGGMRGRVVVGCGRWPSRSRFSVV